MVNYLLTITSQHPHYKESPGLWPEGGIDCSSGDEPRDKPRLAGAPGSNVMSLSDARPQANLLSELVLAIVGALGLGVTIAAAIIGVCS
jgi:hypothetical protein